LEGTSVTEYKWITFLTDYGLENKFVGVCHGVMARIAPAARVMDITHLVPRGDIRHGAVVFRQSVPYLPPAVHLTVVDPGVGTARRAIVLQAGGQLIVGPDNGLLIWAAEELGGISAAFEITDPAVMLQPMSTTFHGRDLFSPAAAHLAAGRDPASVGSRIEPDSLVRLPDPVLRVDGQEVTAESLLTDRFGNIQTSIDGDLLSRLGIVPGAKLKITVGDAVRIVPYCETFGDVGPGELLGHIDSTGLVALAVNLGDAAAELGLEPGQQFTLSLAG
jgi:S-adenosyl-L-methionine hydrolase (adenosine-forming)